MEKSVGTSGESSGRRSWINDRTGEERPSLAVVVAGD